MDVQREQGSGLRLRSLSSDREVDFEMRCDIFLRRYEGRFELLLLGNERYQSYSYFLLQVQDEGREVGWANTRIRVSSACVRRSFFIFFFIFF